MRSVRAWLPAALAALLVIGFAIANGRTDDDGSSTTGEHGTPTTASATLEADTGTRFSSLRPLTYDELPVEALETLLVIDEGGPFPFDRDDGTFQNREGLLPDRPLGHYREYTVITPGENDRGARRIVAGADGERYYTADHYSSFGEIIPP